MKIKILIVLLTFFSIFSSAQIKISETIKNSSLATDDENALYFVDFWATWCGPCIAAEKQLSSLQRQYPKDFYIMSLSQENSQIVKNFTIKHNLKLGVAIDYDGEAFSKYNIASLPYGILFNAKGEKLWEGHPADFKTYHIDGYLSTNTQKLSVDEMFKLQSYLPVAIPKEADLEQDFEIVEIEEPLETLEIIEKQDFLQLTGSLKDIIAYTNYAYKNQVNMPSELNKTYRMRFKYDTKALKKMEKIILKQLKLRRKDASASGEALFLNLSNARFWDADQINWGSDTPHFLIGNTDIQADNVSLNQVSFQLANLLELPIIISDADMANKLHDWELHYKYFDLMASNLNDTYGVVIEKRVVEYPNYIITEK